MMMTRFTGCAVVLLAATACQRAPGLEVRTFTVEHLGQEEAWNLIQPYVYVDRDGAAGMMSTSERAITVRETPENLDRIARVLAEHDVDRPDVRLVFQLIEADGFADTDPRIADVVAELGSVFQFRGYRLAGEAVVTATNESRIAQRLRATDGVYQVTAETSWAAAGTIRLSEVTLWRDDDSPILTTTVNVRPGQTLVLGSTPREGSTATLLLTLRAEDAS